jgi:Tfp pilus assembly protein PilX
MIEINTARGRRVRGAILFVVALLAVTITFIAVFAYFTDAWLTAILAAAIMLSYMGLSAWWASRRLWDAQ